MRQRASFRTEAVHGILNAMRGKGRIAFIGLIGAICFSCASSSLPDVRKPLFSKTGGFYSEEFYLEFNLLPGETAYYTLDGSEPNAEHVGAVASQAGEAATTYVYTKPIKIRNRDEDPNYFSEIKTSEIPNPFGTTDLFSWWGGKWIRPTEPVEKATIIRAKACGSDGSMVVEESGTFWVDSRFGNGNTMAVFSAYSDPSRILGYKSGILVPGESYDLDLPIDAFAGMYGNYSQSGPLWERPVIVEAYDPGGAIEFQSGMGIRIGGQARGQPMHALDFYARSEYGSSHIKHDLFDDGQTSFEKFKLRAGGSTWYSCLIGDDIFQRLVQPLGLDVQRSRPTVLFLNGEYWGMYMLRDIYSKQYLAEKHGLDATEEEDLDFYVNTKYDSGDGLHYASLLAQLDAATSGKTAALSDADLASAATMMDMENFIDYSAAMHCFLAQIYPDNHNDKRWRLRSGGGTGAKDGRWRWLVIDGDQLLGTGTGGQADKIFENVYGPAGYLVWNASFRISFLNRIADIMNTILKPAYAIPKIRELTLPMLQELPYHIARWGYGTDFYLWAEQFEKNARLRSEALGALDSAIDYFNTNWSMGISGTGKLSVSTLPGAGGTITVNRVEIGAATPGVVGAPYPWTGTYFRDIPVPVVAKPAAGYKFSNWVGDDRTTAAIEIVLGGDKELTAVFEKE